MGQKVSAERLREIKTGDGRPLYSSHFEQVLLDVQNRSYEQYPWLAEGKQSCTVTDNFLPDNPIIWINDEFEKMTLYPKEEILGRNCRFLQGKATNRETVQDIKAALSLGSAISVELLNYRKDGVAFWNDFQILPVYARQETVPRIVTHFIAIQIDVTHMKQTGKYFEGWSPAEVGSWLVSEELGDMSRTFLRRGIQGFELSKLTKEDVENMGFTPKEAIAFANSFERLKKKPTQNISDKDAPKMTSMKNSVAIKCFLDDCIQVFTIPKATTLTEFKTSIKRSLGSEYIVSFAGGNLSISKDEWKSTLKNATQTIHVKLSRPREKETRLSSSKSRRSLETSPSGSSSEAMNESSSSSLEEDETQTPPPTRLFRSDSAAISSVFINVKKLFEGGEEGLTQFSIREGAESKEVADALFNLYSIHGISQTLFKWAVNTELKRIQNYNTFLRGNNLQARLFSSLFTSEPALRYLHKYVGPTIDRISRETSLEMDPSKVTTEVARERATWIAKEIKELFYRLNMSVNSCPLPIREAMLMMKKGLDEKFPDNATSVLISVLFLRFLVPAFLDPSNKGNLSTSSSANLRAFSRILQNVANDSVNESGRDFMEPIQNESKALYASLARYLIKICSEKKIQGMREMLDASVSVSSKMKEESLMKLKIAVAESQNQL